MEIRERATAGRASPGLSGAARQISERIDARVGRALHTARATGAETLSSVTIETARPLDPTAVAAASRRPGEPWFCFEQRDRDGAALASLGCSATIEASGAERFATVQARWNALAREAVADAVDGPPGAGLIATGGFAFDPSGGDSPAWSGFAPASLTVPEVSLVRRAGRSWMTVNIGVTPDDVEADVVARVRRRLDELGDPSLPLLDPSPVGAHRVVSPMPPAHFEEAVARAVHRIHDGELRKLVLAREVDVHAPSAHDPAAVLGLLRDAFDSSFVYAVGRGDATFCGATPELLVRRQGQRASTVALAGSMRRSADPAVDDHLGEQLLRSDKDRAENAIVAQRIARALRPHSVWVAAADEPVVIKVANIQHLAAPIRAQLAAPMDAVTLAGLLHPTPAVGAEPAAALPLIPALEGFDRGWYAGTVGWTDSTGDGEFCVALRCALLRGPHARCYAGCGIVAGSDPAAELAESEIKLGVMLPALAG